MRTIILLALLISTSFLQAQEKEEPIIDSLKLELEYLEIQIEKFSDLLDAKIEALEKVDVEKSLKESRKKIDESLERIKAYRKELSEDYPALSEKQKQLLKESGLALRQSMSALGAALEIWTAQIAESWQQLMEE
jgi:chromosome segregation ATPase